MRKMVVITVAEGHQGKSGAGSLVGWNTTGRKKAMYTVAMNHQAADAQQTHRQTGMLGLECMGCSWPTLAM
jgi:hypothetical protein